MELDGLKSGEGLLNGESISLSTILRKALPSLSNKTEDGIRSAIDSGAEIYLVGNRLVEFLGRSISIRELQPEARDLVLKITNRPQFIDRAHIGDLMQDIEADFARRLSTVRRDDCDFMVSNTTLEVLLASFDEAGLSEHTTLKSSVNVPDFKLLEITDPANPNGVVTFFTSGHPLSFRENRGVNIDLLKTQVRPQLQGLFVSIKESDLFLLGEPPTLKLINIDDLSPESDLAADIAARFLRHATVDRVGRNPITLSLTNGNLNFLVQTLTYQYLKFWSSESPLNFRRLYELGVAEIALREDQDLFPNTHQINLVLYQVFMASIALAAKGGTVNDITYDHSLVFKMMELY